MNRSIRYGHVSSILVVTDTAKAAGKIHARRSVRRIGNCEILSFHRVVWPVAFVEQFNFKYDADVGQTSPTPTPSTVLMCPSRARYAWEQSFFTTLKIHPQSQLCGWGGSSGTKVDFKRLTWVCLNIQYLSMWYVKRFYEVSEEACLRIPFQAQWRACRTSQSSWIGIRSVHKGYCFYIDLPAEFSG